MFEAISGRAEIVGVHTNDQRVAYLSLLH